MAMEAPTPVEIPPEKLSMSEGSNSSVSTSSSQKSTLSSPSQRVESPERSPERLPSHRGQKEAKSSERKEAKSSERKEAKSSERKEARSSERKEARSSERKEARSSERKEARSSERRDARSSEHKDARSSAHKEAKSSADQYETTVTYKSPVEDLGQKIMNAEKAAIRDSINDFKIQDDCCCNFLKSCPCPCGGGIVADLVGFICFPLSIFSLLSCLCFKCPFSCGKSKQKEEGTAEEATSEVKNRHSTSDSRSQADHHHHVERRSTSEGPK